MAAKFNHNQLEDFAHLVSYVRLYAQTPMKLRTHQNTSRRGGNFVGESTFTTHLSYKGRPHKPTYPISIHRVHPIDDPRTNFDLTHGEYVADLKTITDIFGQNDIYFKEGDSRRELVLMQTDPTLPLLAESRKKELAKLKEEFRTQIPESIQYPDLEKLFYIFANQPGRQLSTYVKKKLGADIPYTDSVHPEDVVRSYFQKISDPVPDSVWQAILVHLGKQTNNSGWTDAALARLRSAIPSK